MSCQKRLTIPPWTAALSAAALLGCSPPRPTIEDGRAAFLSKRAAMEQLIPLVAVCRPTDGRSFTRVFADEQRYPAMTCGAGDPQALQAIRTALRRNGFIAVSWLPEPNDPDGLRSVTFMITTRGIAVSGSSSDIAYHPDPQPCRAQVQRSDTGSYERRPLTGAPCHWFWTYRSS